MSGEIEKKVVEVIDQLSLTKEIEMLNNSPALFTKSDEYGMQVNVRQYGAKFHAILTDMDADQSAGVIICKSLDQAIEKANEMVK